MLYDSERIKWWNQRSSSLEYQTAYANVAKLIRNVGGTLVDVGCGSGGLIKKVLPYFGKIIGTDTSDKMLSLANKRTNKNRKVELVNDNILFSRLSSEIADATTFTFPEFGFVGEFSQEDEEFDGKLLNFVNSFELSREEKSRLILELRKDYHLARITKVGGYFVDVNYDRWENPNAERERISYISSRQRELFGLHLMGAKYFRDERIARDASGKSVGYNILVFRKIEHKLL